MQIAVSIEPYLDVEKVKLIQYIENIVRISRSFQQNHRRQVCLHFDYFKPNPEVFRLVQSYADQIDIDLHLMQEAAPSVDGFRSVVCNVMDWQKNLSTTNGVYLDLGCEVQNYEAAIRAAHYIIIMTVKCGKSGQTFQSSAVHLISQVRRLNPGAVIIVDGGVNESNIQLLKEAGADVAVVGNYAKKCYEDSTLTDGINRLLHD